MGKLFPELLDTELFKHTRDDFPDWLHVVLSDWIFWSRAYRLPAPSLADLGALCQADELPEHAWLELEEETAIDKVTFYDTKTEEDLSLDQVHPRLIAWMMDVLEQISAKGAGYREDWRALL